MINVYPSTVKSLKDVKGHGLGTLDPETFDPVVHWELNGEYTYKFSYPKDGRHAQDLVQENVIKIDSGPEQNLFRIKMINPDLDTKLEVFCEQIATDLLGNMISDINIVEQSGVYAMEHIAQGIDFDNPFRLYSDIKTTSSARIQRQNVLQAILDTQTPNNFINRWGGEIYRKNFEVGMLRRLGQDRGVEIRYGKNLTGFEAKIDSTEMATIIRPVGHDGLELPEKYIYSDKATSDRILVKVVNYDDIKAIDETQEERDPDEDALPKAEALEKLRERAKEEFSEHHVDEPKATFKVDFQELSNTEEYKDIKQLETIGPGDDVRIITPDYDISARCISYDYDPMAQEYTSMTLGNFLPTMSSTIDVAIDRAVDEVVTPKIDYAIHKAANGKNVVVTSEAEPVGKFIEGDIWIKPIGDGKYEIRFFHNGIWPLEADISDKIFEELERKLNQMKKESDQAIAEVSETARADLDAAIAALNKEKKLYITKKDAYGRIEAATSPDNLYTSINKMTADQISMLVGKGDLIGEINLQAGQTIIRQGEKSYLRLTEDTVYSPSMWITDAMVKDLSATKIKTGTLDASNVRVINLDAQSISGNEANLIKAMFGSLNSSLKITGSGVDIYTFEAPGSYSAQQVANIDKDGMWFYDYDKPGNIAGHIGYTYNTNKSGYDQPNDFISLAAHDGYDAAISYESYGGNKTPAIIVHDGDGHVSMRTDVTHEGHYIWLNSQWSVFAEDSSGGRSPQVRISYDKPGGGYYDRFSIASDGIHAYKPLNMHGQTIWKANNISADGTVSGSKVIETSDKRLKTVLGDYRRDPEENIKNAEFVHFKWKENYQDPKEHDGILAQSVPGWSTDIGGGYLGISLGDQLNDVTLAVRGLLERVEKLEEGV